MLYEYDGKTYIKPLVNKMVEVEVSKKGKEYDIKPTKNMVYITEDVKKKMNAISKEDVLKKANKPLDIGM
jgi:predicted GIY-YIG superfamily endonuclease